MTMIINNDDSRQNSGKFRMESEALLFPKVFKSFFISGANLIKIFLLPLKRWEANKHKRVKKNYFWSLPCFDGWKSENKVKGRMRKQEEKLKNLISEII